MTKFALLKKVSFSVKDSNVGLYLADKVSFHEFNGTINLFHKIHELLGGGMVEILNCDYDEQYLMQAFYLENTEDDIYDNIIIVKRNINPNDNYVYTTEPELIENDNYIHTDVNFEDVEKIMLRKFKNSGVQINDNNTMHNISYTTTNDHKTHSGILHATVKNESNTHSVKFIDIPSIVKLHEKENLTPEQFSQLLSDKVVEVGAEYFYTQKDFGMGLLNCYCPLFGHTKNEIMSKLLAEPAYGNAYIGLENHLNDDTRILPLDILMVNKILKFLSTADFKQKNGIFCNVFYELSDC